MVLRALEQLRLPHSLRMTIGTEEPIASSSMACATSWRASERAADVQSSRADRLRLIGGSIARARARTGACGQIVTTARSPKTRARVAELGIVDRVSNQC